MYSLLTDKMYNEIVDALLDKDFLNRLSIHQKFIKSHIHDIYFHGCVSTIVEDKDYSCSRVLKLCKNMLNDMAGDDGPDNWLEYIFQYTLSKSFPEAIEIKLLPSLNHACELYLKVLRIVSEFQKQSDDRTWQSIYPLYLLTEEEEKELENPWEYLTFKKAFYDEYIYEMMKLNQEVKGYTTLDHISGVHYLALHIGRQLKAIGLPIDLGRVSGAAAGHDIGKYGCKGTDAKRVPYLHYYYSDQWFKKHDINYIRNIAINHSTWDLELENLSLESLILIYCDFRVKARDKRENGTNMYIYSLKESFDVILDKLDNVDEAKERRYRRVYGKLKDFEDYLMDMGIRLDPDRKDNKVLSIPEKHFSLMQGEEIVENLKYLAINHNIRLMHRLRDESSLNAILEIARSESETNNLRRYLNVFEEYSTYMTQKQKMITINFLYDLLIHPEDDIRRQCAELIGILIAMFDEEYRKEVPQSEKLDFSDVLSTELLDKYLKLMIYPDIKFIPIHRSWIGYNMTHMIAALFERCRKGQVSEYISILSKYYANPQKQGTETRLYMLETIKYIPVSDSDGEIAATLCDYLEKLVDVENDDVRLSVLEAIYHLLGEVKDKENALNRLQKIIQRKETEPKLSAESFLTMKIIKALGIKTEDIPALRDFQEKSSYKVSDLFLSNLKTATNWSIKKIQVDVILEHVKEAPSNQGIHAAMHFCNLLKVSASESVRNRAGEALVAIAPYLTMEQRNDIAVELLRALEIEGYQFTKYIPDYFGRWMLHLQPVELDELIDDFIVKNKQSNTLTNALIIRTIGVAIENYADYKALYKEDERTYDLRFCRMLGIILNGLVHYNQQIKQIAFSVMGKDVFGSKKLDLEQKNYIFRLVSKKVLTLLVDTIEDKELIFLNNAAGLNHIYRFISDCKFYRGKIDIKIPERIAFFPGTFDPFSLSHKEIAREIRNLGFEVYLAVDEFSWSKKTQPNLIRRNIIKMSIADELEIYMFPKDLPVNIANQGDLRMLKEKFPESDVHVVVGSDVVVNASAYKVAQGENTIHSFSHIIFERASDGTPQKDMQLLDEAVKRIEGNVVRLTLAPRYEDISSTQIRNYIDQNRDISKLIDPLAQKYILDRGLYRREPQYKTLLQTKSVTIEIVYDPIPDELLMVLAKQFFQNPEEAYLKLCEFANKLNPRLLLIRSINQDGKILGFSAFHWIRSSTLFQELKNERISNYVRENSVGRILVLDGVFVEESPIFHNLEQVILTETLAFCIAKDYSYAVYYNTINEYVPEKVEEVLRLQGFQRLDYGEQNNPVYTVNMTTPCTLSLDIKSVIKEPFASSPRVGEAIYRSRKRLQEAITKFYPGHLVLSFSRSMMYENLIHKICEENEVSTEPLTPRVLGPGMCVPYGTILNGCTIPNTVTKSLHIDRLFTPDMNNYKTGAYPYYLDLENQVKVIAAFNRPLILVDDILVKGYRLRTLDPLLNREGVQVKKVIVGILSDRGKELMDMQQREVDCAYFIPRLKLWFNESLLYPYIGGDTLWRGEYPERNLIPSVNLIMPYMYPAFIKGTSKGAIYNLSYVSMMNAIDILSTIEEEYQEMHERNFTMGQLGEVFVSPRYPDHGRNISMDVNLSPLHYLENDMEHLKRLKRVCFDSRRE
ncbi:MAG: cytidyltransferase [Bacillota bacterium]